MEAKAGNKHVQRALFRLALLWMAISFLGQALQTLTVMTEHDAVADKNCAEEACNIHSSLTHKVGTSKEMAAVTSNFSSDLDSLILHLAQSKYSPTIVHERSGIPWHSA